MRANIINEKCIQHNAENILAKKLVGYELEKSEIKWFIDNIVSGHIKPSQIGAFLVAIFTNGMSDGETVVLTKSMALSGSCLCWNDDIKNIVVDKHSTGGIGDKISLVLLPILAACGMYVPSIAGRGLGITGGTIDKLESIPGMQFEYTAKEIQDLTLKTGVCIVSQSNEINPADKIIYATRDVTSTVASIPLGTSSIMSKKYCETLSHLLLDVKCGNAAFMKSIDIARIYANSLKKVGTLLGIKTTVAITQMDIPIGITIGNSLEIVESLETLKGYGHHDLLSIVQAFASIILLSAGLVTSRDEGVIKANEVIYNGLALEKFLAMIKNQGVKKEIVDKLQMGKYIEVFGKSRYKYQAKITKPGFIVFIDAFILGKIVQSIGGGRFKKDDKIDYQAGIRLMKHVGDCVKEGDIWCIIDYNINTNKIDFASEIEHSVVIGNSPDHLDRILDIL